MIQSFKDLDTWKQGHKLVLMVYKVTGSFPKAETYSLTDQMRRAVVSITSNVAEGFDRQGLKEKIQFLYLALGSCYELENQILVAKDLGYMAAGIYEEIENQIQNVSRLINGFIRSLKTNF